MTICCLLDFRHADKIFTSTQFQYFSMSEGLAESLRILNPAVLKICKIGYFSKIQGCGTDFTAVYTVLKLEKKA